MLFLLCTPVQVRFVFWIFKAWQVFAGCVTFLSLVRRVCNIAKSDYSLCHVRSSAWNSSHTGRILIKLDI
jgi:hypothetical protein